MAVPSRVFLFTGPRLAGDRRWRRRGAPTSA